jgi:hypothetical protein
MAAKQRADRQKEKEKREKIILAVLVVVLIVVGAIELPSFLGKKSSPAAAVQTSTGLVTTPGGTAGGSVAPSQVGTLSEAQEYQPEEGQLKGFNLFGAKDPFGDVPTATSSTTPAPTTTTQTTTTPTGAEMAEISTNGATEIVPIGAVFPATSPSFVLDSVKSKEITISVSGGSFAGGQTQLKIAKGKSVTLANTATGMRYTVKFVQEVTPQVKVSTTIPILSTPATTTGEPSGAPTPPGTTSSSATTTTSVGP